MVDDEFGVVLDVEVTTGEANEGDRLLERLDAAGTITGAEIATVTADAGHAYGPSSTPAWSGARSRLAPGQGRASSAPPGGVGAPAFGGLERVGPPWWAG